MVGIKNSIAILIIILLTLIAPVVGTIIGVAISLMLFLFFNSEYKKHQERERTKQNNP